MARRVSGQGGQISRRQWGVAGSQAGGGCDGPATGKGFPCEDPSVGRWGPQQWTWPTLNNPVSHTLTTIFPEMLGNEFSCPSALPAVLLPQGRGHTRKVQGAGGRGQEALAKAVERDPSPVHSALPTRYNLSWEGETGPEGQAWRVLFSSVPGLAGGSSDLKVPENLCQPECADELWA